jgi:hypothetical protein
MSDREVNLVEVLNRKSIGSKVNSYVHRVAPEKEPDYEAMNRLMQAQIQHPSKDE